MMKKTFLALACLASTQLTAQTAADCNIQLYSILEGYTGAHAKAAGSHFNLPINVKRKVLVLSQKLKSTEASLRASRKALADIQDKHFSAAEFETAVKEFQRLSSTESDNQAIAEIEENFEQSLKIAFEAETIEELNNLEAGLRIDIYNLVYSADITQLDEDIKKTETELNGLNLIKKPILGESDELAVQIRQTSETLQSLKNQRASLVEQNAPALSEKKSRLARIEALLFVVNHNQAQLEALVASAKSEKELSIQKVLQKTENLLQEKGIQERFNEILEKQHIKTLKDILSSKYSQEVSSLEKIAVTIKSELALINKEYNAKDSIFINDVLRDLQEWSNADHYAIFSAYENKLSLCSEEKVYNTKEKHINNYRFCSEFLYNHNPLIVDGTRAVNTYIMKDGMQNFDQEGYAVTTGIENLTLLRRNNQLETCNAEEMRQASVWKAESLKEVGTILVKGVAKNKSQEKAPVVVAPAKKEQKPEAIVAPATKEQKPTVIIAPATKEQKPTVIIAPATKEQKPAVIVVPATKEQKPEVIIAPATKEQKIEAQLPINEEIGKQIEIPSIIVEEVEANLVKNETEIEQINAELKETSKTIDEVNSCELPTEEEINQCVDENIKGETEETIVPKTVPVNESILFEQL